MSLDPRHWRAGTGSSACTKHPGCTSIYISVLKCLVHMFRDDRGNVMRRISALLVGALSLAAFLVVGSGRAGAVAPVTQTFAFADTITGVAPSCGLPLSWDIEGSVERTLFFDKDGQVVRIQDQVRESNTITNLETGETLQEGPDSFIQRILFGADGSVTVQINGLSVLVNQGDNSVVDAGRVVLFFGPSGPSVLSVSGRHDIRGIDPLTVDDPILLDGFCPAFA